MIKKLFSLSHKTLLIIFVIIVALGAGLIVNKQSNAKNLKENYPKYFNFSGNYVFNIPKNYTVDEQSALGIQLVYSGLITVKTLDDVYNAGGIAVYAVSDLTDHSSKAFKDYANNTFVSGLKKNLSTNDVKIDFSKANGSDDARITVKKDGKIIRYIFLKGGQHPATIVANSQTSAVNKIADTITDIESSSLKSEAEPIKKAIQSTAQLTKDHNVTQLYSSATSDLRSKSTNAELDKALKDAATYTGGNITISGGSYAPDEFSSAIRFTTLSKDNSQTAYGSMTLKKTEGQWKLQALSLPTPKQ